MATPTFENVAYGAHVRNVLDLYLAASESPTPLYVFIHGGGFRGGDKGAVPPELLDACLETGISVAANMEIRVPVHYLGKTG